MKKQQLYLSNMHLSVGIYEVYSKINKKNIISKLLIATLFLIILFFVLMFYPLDYALARTIVYSIIIHLILKKTKYKYIIEYYFYKIIFKRKCNYQLLFYDDCFKIVYDTYKKEYLYSNVSELIETDDLFFLKCNRELIIVDKTECKGDCIMFIRNKINNTTNLLGDKYKIENRISLTKKDKIKYFSIILSILSLLLGIITWVIVSKWYPNALSLSVIWVFLLFVPFPIISIILCIKNNCLKNCIFHIIILIIMLISGYNSKIFNDNFKKQYDSCFEFEKIFNIKLPNKGDYYRISWDISEHRLLASNYILIEKNSFSLDENYIEFNEFINDFKSYIPDDMLLESNETSRFVIYFRENNVFNKIPDDKKNEKVYLLMYNKSKNFIQIDSYFL